jgi:hypothetical protein
MKTFLSSAIALTALGTTVLAAPDPAPSNESDWARLDREIGELSASLNRPASGTNVGGLVRAYYAHSTDDAFEQNGAPNTSVNSGGNLSALWLKDVDLFAEGSVAEYDWRISFDLKPVGTASSRGTALLEDAYARWNVGGGVNLTVGQFKAPTTRSTAVRKENLVLPDRTFVGQILEFWDPGAMVTGNWRHFGGFVAVQNGADGAVEEHLYVTRAEVKLNGGTGRVEGGFGAPSGVAATGGLFWLQDGMNANGGHAVGGDVSLTVGPFGAHVEVVEFDGELLGDAASGNSKIVGDSANDFNFLGAALIPLNYVENNMVRDATVWSSTLSCLIEAIDVEVAARFEVYDDPGNTRSATVGANWYRSGKNAVWHVGVTQVRSNDPIPGGGGNGTAVNGPAEGVGDATLFQVGLSVGMSTANI